LKDDVSESHKSSLRGEVALLNVSLLHDALLNVLQCVAVCCSVLQSLLHDALLNVLQCVAVECVALA